MSADAVGKSLIEVTVTVTSAEEISPLASVMLYEKVSVPLKLAKGE